MLLFFFLRVQRLLLWKRIANCDYEYGFDVAKKASHYQLSLARYNHLSIFLLFICVTTAILCNSICNLKREKKSLPSDLEKFIIQARKKDENEFYAIFFFCSKLLYRIFICTITQTDIVKNKRIY